MPILLQAAPPPIAIERPAVRSHGLSEAQIQAAVAQMRARLPRTPVVAAKASAIPGLIAVELANGQVVHLDSAGRYLLLGLAFDLTTGQPLEGLLEGSPSVLGPESELEL